MRLLVSGYRLFDSYEVVATEIQKILPSTENVIIHGGCAGVDRCAGYFAKINQIQEQVFKPDWSLGKRAGPLRNEKMIVEGRPDHALLFLSRESRGTLNMLNLVKQYQILYTVIIVD